MSLLTVLKVSVTFAGRALYHEIGFQVEQGDRVGLVGPNGSGKTTLLRLITGEMSPEKGEIRIARGTRLGYLPQDVHENLQGSLLKAVVDSIPERVELEKDLKKTEDHLQGLNKEREQIRLAERLAEIHQKINHLDAQFPRHEAEKILTGLGFQIVDFEKPVSTLSGGWKMRAALASLLYRKPDLLLLDEPTNHLDIPSVRWLEQFLQSFKGAMILVSHDRDFLNRQVSRILSFEPEGLRSYSGNYDFYVKAREEESGALEARARNQQQKIKEAQKFIERFRAKASKARQAQSKIKLVQKMALVETHKREKTIHFSFPDVSRTGKEVLSLKGLAKGFNGKALYKDVDLTVLRGERVSIIGPNGCGKTTLLKMVAGEMPWDRGTVTLGHEVEMSYFAQHHSEMLDPHKTVLEEVQQVVPQKAIGFVRNVCGAFLFTGEDVEKKVGVLSGGERARVSLAKILVMPGNFMVMDEPTNHLDLISSERLIDALTGYGGTLLFVSHNQSFINRLATKIWDIRDERILEYPGNLAEYYDHIARLEAAPQNGDWGTERRPDQHLPQDMESAGRKREGRKSSKRQRAERRRFIQNTLGPILARLGDLEERIAALESRQKDLEGTLADPDLFKDQEKSVPLITEYRENREHLDELMAKWEGCQSELESAQKGLGLHDEN